MSESSASVCRRVSVSHRWSGVRADIAAFLPGQVEAPDELQVEGMTAVQHGEAHNVGLIAHHLFQPKQREVLETDGRTETEKEEKEVTSSVCLM